MSSLGSRTRTAGERRQRYKPVMGDHDERKEGRALGAADRGKREGSSRFALATALHAVESGIRHETNEHARLLDAKTGAVLLEKAGRKTRSGRYAHVIEFSAEEVARMRGGILTHNHPGNESFTDADIELAASHGLAEIRAVTSDTRYSMRAPATGWSRETWLKRIKPEYDQALRDVTNELVVAVRHGQMDPERADMQMLHMTWERVARATGVKYTRETWNKPQPTYPRKPKTAP